MMQPLALPEKFELIAPDVPSKQRFVQKVPVRFRPNAKH
jgi:hypothetical protein